MSDPAKRLGVCSWSLQPETPAELIAAMKEIGLDQVQLALDPLRESPQWAEAPQQLADAGIKIISGMFATIGEDYSTLESIRKTGGIVPDETWAQNWANIERTVPIAEKLGIRIMLFHAGFIPHEAGNPTWEKVRDRVGQIADLYADADVTLTLETGQEDAPTLLKFISEVDRPNVAVNFDPANMILYDKGDPVEALRTLMPHVRHIHIKDADRTTTPGTWGTEKPAGEGQVDWDGFFAVLDDERYQGYLAIEREGGDQRVQDIRTAKEMVLQYLAT
ncbi:MAG: sugar phosphate isomerase/epimerase family protein [Phycisphaeraceae bacterium]